MSKIKFISLDKLLEMYTNREEFKVLESMSPEYFSQGHLPGAINIPLDKVRVEASNHFNGSDTIVVYCLDYKCHASTKAAKILQQLGYFNVFDFKAGKKAWVDAGLDLEI